MYIYIYHHYILLYSMIVTGDAVGCVKFFDNDLKMLNWYVCMYIEHYHKHVHYQSILFLLGTII